MNEKKNIGFKVPEGYFEEFQNTIPEIIAKEESVSKTKTLRMYYTIAASIVLIAISSLVLIPTNTPQNKTVLYQLSDTDYYDLKMNDLYFAYNEDSQTEPISNDNEEIINYITDEMDLDEIIILSE